jgi:OmcA/MtrC family decaheme c-type cytochrome
MGDPGTTPPGPWVVADRVDVTVTGLTFDSSGTHVDFTLEDKDGKPLDRTGMLTPGKVTVSFVLAQLGVNSDGSPAQYTAYTKRTVNAVPPYPTASATQATTEGLEANFVAVDVTKGSYRYTFAASTAERVATQTQSVLAVAARTVDGVQSFDRDLFHDGAQRREEITDATCGSCHGSFSAHGGRYTKPDQCILCHSAQTSDPETGNTVDFRVMIHKLHRGADLPSVIADPANPYQIVGFGPTVHDYATVAFPGPTTTLATNISRCETCHAGAQANAWYARPSNAACTACHDTTVFTATQNPPFTISHQGGVDPTLVNDSTCIVCHGQTAGPAPVPASHYTGIWNPTNGTMTITILSVANTAPGQLPTIRFQVAVNDAPRDIIAAPLSTLTATIAGPTSDFTEYWQARVQGSGAVGSLVAVDAVNGVFDYTFPATSNPASPPCTESSVRRDCSIPPSASGSYQAAFEANWTPPTTGAQRIVADPPRLAFAVTGTKVERRAVVEAARCNGCHFDLSFHGGGRKDPNYCVMCHNPSNANDERISRVEGSTVLAESVDFRVMIHKIHMGEELSQAYILGGNPAPTVTNPVGAPEDFGEVRYPRDRRACAACHVGPSWQLPMTASTKYAPSVLLELSCSEPLGNDTDNYCTAPFWTVTKTTRVAPESSVCTSCHDAPYTAAHAVLNTTAGGVEACATCHGPGKEFDVARYHGTP